MKTTHALYLVSSLALNFSCGVAQDEPQTVEPAAAIRSALSKSGSRIQLRLDTTIQTTSDGAAFEVPAYSPQPFDSKLGTNCNAQIAEDGVTRCLPNGAPTVSGYYLDRACKEALVLTFPCDAAPKYAIEPISDTSPACPSVTRNKVFQVRAEVKPSRSYIKSGSACYDRGTPSDAYKWYTLGAAMAASEFVTMRVTTRTDTLP